MLTNIIKNIYDKLFLFFCIPKCYEMVVIGIKCKQGNMGNSRVLKPGCYRVATREFLRRGATQILAEYTVKFVVQQVKFHVKCYSSKYDQWSRGRGVKKAEMGRKHLSPLDSCANCVILAMFPRMSHQKYRIRRCIMLNCSTLSGLTVKHRC